MRKLLLNQWVFAATLILLAFSCSEDQPAPEKAIASFQFAVDAAQFNKVTFTNFSQNAVSLSWNFDDGTALSTDENPVHEFATEGTYTVSLTATGAGGDTSVKELDVVVTDPNVELKKLTGETSKTWKLIRDVSKGSYPMAVGPEDRSQIWWALGLQEALGKRPCVLNDEYIFSLNGDYEYKTNGDFYAESGVWSETIGAGCHDSDDANYINVDGTDISDWNDGVHEFQYNVAAKTITVSGSGAFVGLTKAATDSEVKVPQTSVTYKVIRLVDSSVDTLILETTLPNPAYWRFVLVHYDNPLEEPEIPGTPPSPSFSVGVNDKTATFTNNSTDADSYSWDFGDGATSTETSPVHTYAASGAYNVVLTATNSVSSVESSQSVIVGAAEITLADLTGGSTRTWKLKPVAGAYRVGPGRGDGSWFASNMDDVANRACMFDDEFIFKSTLGYTYDSKGQVYGESFMAANGCTNDANLTGVYTGLGSNNTHTFEFIPSTASEPVKIKVKGTGAFVGFAKGYNGGEYNGADGALQTSVTYDVVSFVNTGGVLTLDISVHINGDGWWSMTLVSQ